MYIITIPKPLVFISNDGDNNTDNPFSLHFEIMMVKNTPQTSFISTVDDDCQNSVPIFDIV